MASKHLRPSVSATPPHLVDCDSAKTPTLIRGGHKGTFDEENRIRRKKLNVETAIFSHKLVAALIHFAPLLPNL